MIATLLPENTTVQVTPDEARRHIAPSPAALIPLFAVCTLQPAGDGTYRPVLRLYDKLISIALAAKLTGIADYTIRRLLRAGFVEGGQPSPGAYSVSVPSLCSHLAATQDTEFWTDKRRQQWSAAL